MNFLLAADIPGIGRPEAVLLTDQQRMELLFTPKHEAESRAALQGDLFDSCSWNGISCAAGGEVMIINWSSGNVVLHGSLDFQMIPLHCRRFSLIKQDLEGEIRTNDLPRNMVNFTVEGCTVYGTVDLGNLPMTLSIFIVCSNRITHIENIINLPDRLDWCRVRDPNVVQESLHIGSLPPGGMRVDLKGCHIKELTLENPSDADRVILDE